MSEKTEGIIKNEQSRDIGNIWHTRHRTNKKPRKLKRYATRIPTRKLRVNPDDRRCSPGYL